MNNREIATTMGQILYVNNARDKILSTSINEIMAYKTNSGKWTSDDPDLRELITLYRDGSTIGGLVSVMTDALRV